MVVGRIPNYCVQAGSKIANKSEKAWSRECFFYLE